MRNMKLLVNSNILPRVQSKKTQHKEKLSYITLKNKLLTNTIKNGTCLTAFYFLNDTIDNTVSISIGALSSYMYVKLLTKYVDDIHGSNRKPYQLFVPFGYTVFEYLFNNVQNQIHLDFLTTCVGFFSYKIAVFFILIDEIAYMIKDDADIDIK